jgi:beta-galactosidase GanA
VIRRFVEMAGSTSEFVAPKAVEITRRRTGGREWVFALNHSNEAQKVTLPGTFASVLAKKSVGRELELKPYEVVVLQRS